MEFFSDCVVVPEGSVGLDVLKSALEVRSNESGLICGIAGYPAQECGVEIDAPTEQSAVTTSTPSTPEGEASRSTPLLMAVLAAMLVVGFIFNRRRNK